jgi:hypothetical protein
MDQGSGAKIYQFPSKKTADEAKPEVTFKDFHMQTMRGEMKDAAGALTKLLGISAQTSASAAEFYRSRIAADSNHMLKTMALKAAVDSGLTNDILHKLAECFDVQGPEALIALRHLTSSKS